MSFYKLAQYTGLKNRLPYNNFNFLGFEDGYREVWNPFTTRHNDFLTRRDLKASILETSHLKNKYNLSFEC